MIHERLLALEAFQRARTVLFYLTITGEVDTAPVIAAARRIGKRIAVPVTHPDTRRLSVSLLPEAEEAVGLGPHGTREPRPPHVHPIPVDELDLVVVPGLAFDPSGRRLGRGLGYYDRFLATVPEGVPRVGLAYRFQLVETLPVSRRDALVTYVLTD